MFLRFVELLIFLVKCQNCIVTPNFEERVECYVESIIIVKEKTKR